MEKKSLFELICVVLLVGMSVSSCSSDDEDEDNSIPRPSNTIYGDYVRDAKGELASVHYEKGEWFLLDSDGNRYYFYLSSDNVDHEYFDSLVSNGILADGAHVIFDGKVYSTSDTWREAMGNTIPDKEKTFVLMDPYTITKAERLL